MIVWLENSGAVETLQTTVFPRISVLFNFILMFIGHFEDLSSSEDSDSAPPRARPSRNRAKGVSIHDGPQAIAKFRVGGSSKQSGSHISIALCLCWLCVDTAEFILN